MKRNIITLAFCAAVAAGSAMADSHRLQPDFTFKRISVPQSGTTSGRINVQITPSAPSGPSEPRAPQEAGTQTGSVAGAVPRVSELDWFWDAVPPDLSATAPGRLIAAMATVESAPDGVISQPRLSALHQIATAHGRDIMLSTLGTKVSPALALAVIAVESAGNSSAVSGAGAQGLMQLMPNTAARFDVVDPFNPADNIRGGVSYLDWLIDEFDYDPILFIAAYNAGEGSIWDHSGVPNYPETRAYVPKVLAAWSVARALCKTPPELMTDGCVFNLTGE